ncbi:MAG: hypothetical protein ACTJLK_04045 [Anaplasma sp.]
MGLILQIRFLNLVRSAAEVEERLCDRDETERSPTASLPSQAENNSPGKEGIHLSWGSVALSQIEGLNR